MMPAVLLQRVLLSTLVFLALTGAVCLGQKGVKSSKSGGPGEYQKKLKDQDFINAGSAVFIPTCSSAYCHGTGGMGGGAPRLRGRDLDPAYLFKTVSNGVPGTAMIAFKADLTEEQRWELVAFILSPVSSGDSINRAAAGAASSANGPVAAGAGSSMPKGDPSSGRDLFYDLANQRSCHGCHAVQGVGGKVAPDLGALASLKSEAELLSAIVTPHTVTDPKFATVIVSTADGDKIVGVKKEEGREFVRVYDTTVLPVVLRTLPKDQIVKIEASQQPIMPGNYASIYTEKQLADIIAFIKSAPGKSER